MGVSRSVRGPKGGPGLWLLLSVGLAGIAEPSGAATFNYFPAPYDVSPAVAGAWTDVNVSAYVPVGATGVIVQWTNLTSGADRNYGVRMKGSTDNWAFDSEAKDLQQGWLMTGLDSNRVFQVYTGHTAVRTYLVGYTMAGVRFFTNRIDKSTATTGGWVDVSIAADTGSDTAIGAIFHVDCQSGSSVGYALRKKGSADVRTQTLRANMMTLGLVGVDVTETAEQRIAATTIDLYLVGYVTSGAVFFTNALDKSTATTGSYQAVDLTADLGAGVANGAFVEIQPSDGTRRNTAVRPGGAAYDHYAEVSHQFAVVGVDGNDVFEQKIELNTMDVYVTGYSLADSTASFRVKSGSYTGSGVARSITGVGFQPDVVIVDGVNGGAEAVMKTSSMTGANSKQIDNTAAFDATHITSLDADGFSLSTDADVNQNGITYYWTAFKAAPGFMKVGTYAGATLAQNITGVGFTPAYVIVISPNATDTTQKSLLMPTTFSVNFAGAGFDNSILAMQANGFWVGTYAAVAGAGVTFHYVAWNSVPGRIAVGTYAGNKVDNRDITGVGFQPEYVIVDRSSDVGSGTGTSVGNAPVHKTAASGVNTDSSTLFNGNVAEADNIQALLSDGFQVGTHCRVNGDATCNAPVPVAYYWMAFGPHVPRINYRSIGAAANLTNQGTITVTAGSTAVAKTGGTGWKTANRGRGDRVTVGGNSYMIQSVDSDDALTLASPAVASYTGSVYTIARQFTTLQAWESCVSFAVACTYFPVSSASLVADDRREIGIVYDDATPSFTLSGNVQIQGSTTDATHNIILTADGINRHSGVAGAGVVIDANLGSYELDIRDANVTVEWLELVRARGDDISPIQVHSTDGDLATNVVLQNLLIHNFGDKVAGSLSSSGIDLAGDNTLVGKSVIIRNTMIWDGDEQAIEGDGTLDAALIENVTVDGMAYRGIYSSGGPFTVRNTIVTSSPSGDFVAGAGPMSGSHNTSSDTSASSYFTNAQQASAASLYVTPNADLHLRAGAAAINSGLSLTSSFSFDIDGQLRPAGGAWDRGADELGATTAVRLISFAAIPGDSSVTLEWQTGSELDNLGFHLYRGPSADGPWTRLASSLIPGLGSSPLGQAYSWLDAGLVNGQRYYYRLEDVDTASVSTFHGPVSTVPSAPAEGGGDDGGADGTERVEGEPVASSCPSCVLSAAPDAVSPICTAHGNPDSVSLNVLSRSASGATLELRTGGFWTLQDASGTARVFVLGLEFPTDAKAPALPLRRALVDAVIGKQVHLVSAEAFELQSFPGLRPSAVGQAEMRVSRDGTVRPTRRSVASRLLSRGYVPAEVARLSGTVFQGERKSAVVEITPVRFDGSAQKLVLAGRVRVKLSFVGVAGGEVRTGSGGRVLPPRGFSRDVLAQLHTSRRGLHAVRYEALFPTDRRGFSTSLLRLQRQGEAVPFHIAPSGPVFGPGSVLYYFADRMTSSTEYSSEVAYELVRGTGVRMGVTSAPPAGAPVASSSTGFSSFETNRIYQPGLLEAPDIWLWDGMASGAVRTQGFTLAGVEVASRETARVVVHLQGGSESGITADHHLRFSVNGSFVGEATFAGKRPQELEVPIPASVLKEEANELSVANVGDTGVYSLVFLDRFELSYPQPSTARQGVFEGVWAEGGTVEVSGLSGLPVILRDPGQPGPEGSAVRWVTGFQATGSSVRFQAEANHRYVVVSPEGLLAPRIGRAALSTLKAATNQADYLVIAPREFLGAAQPLVERRRGQGLVSRAVSFEEIASAFGHGQPSAEAIRAFLKYAYHSWQRPSPRYVVLLGDATYDPRRFQSTSWASPLPALWTKTSYLWTASDPALGAVNGNDSLPDMVIARLPATTREQAEALVGKLLAWEDSGQGLSGNAVLVADDPDLAGDFEADVEDIRASFLSGRPTTTLKVKELGAGTRAAILGAFDEGASLVSYVGHGGTAVWASENVLNSWDTPSLLAQSRQPLLLTLNCLNGYFVAPNFDSLGEALLKAEGRGVIAAFSPSGLSLDGPAHQYHRAVVGEIASGTHERLGDAILVAQRSYAETGLMPELLTVYQLLGDPAMRIR